jgi:hypothetical protein
MKKPITFKQAGMIVIVLHVAGFIGFTQYASYRAAIAKQLRESKKTELLSEIRSQQDWNNVNIKPRIVAVATPKKPSSPSNKENQKGDMLRTVQNFAVQTTDKIKQELKEVNVSSTNQQQPARTKPVTSTVWKVEVKQPSPTPSIVASKQQAQKRKIDIASIKQNVNKLKSEIQTIKTVSFSNGLVTQTTEEIQQRMSSHIVLR